MLDPVAELASACVGDTFTVFAEVCGDDPQGLLLVTDANGMFGTAVEIVRSLQFPQLIPSMVVVGVGYPSAKTLGDTVQIRARDLTPTHSSLFGQSGHADAFAAFLNSELRPWIGERYGACAEDMTYFGHSLGGLFGAHVLLTQPALFGRYILSSPSLWWDHYLIERTEQTFSEAATDLSAQVFCAIGALETDEGRREEGRKLPETHPSKPPAIHLDMVADLERFVATLSGRRYPSLSVESLVLPNEYHVTAAPVALSRGLRHFHP